MTQRQAIEYCLSQKGAYLDFPFGPDVTVVKVGVPEKRPGKIFAQVFTLKEQNTITLNCDQMTGMFYRRLYPDTVVRGYHCPPIQQPYFNTLPLDGAVPDEQILEMIGHSYHTVVSKLPKYIQNDLA